MRRWLPFALLAALAAAQDQEGPSAPEHDELGFPITFNDDIITESDVERSLGQKRAAVPPITFRNERNVILKRKLAEEIAAELSIEVADREVDEEMRKRIDVQGGEAKFYESLAQQGLTLERFRNYLRQLILDSKLQFMFQTGVTHDQAKLLPWRVKPTPREIRIAHENDPVRRDAGARVQRLELVIDVDEKTRKKLAVRPLLDPDKYDDKWFNEELARRLQPQLQTVLDELEGGRSFEEVAKARGVDVETQKQRWIQLSRDVQDAGVRFLQEAKAQTYSPPLRRTGGGYRILYLIKRERPGDRPASDPEVALGYERRIRSLRALKYQALMQIQALDRSTVRPERVRANMRQELLAELREAEEKLGELGLH
ncbi:MAG: SurA N-terminal domain-containing protein [Planctomycetota bacterium]|jgi:hypothetical protein